MTSAASPARSSRPLLHLYLQRLEVAGPITGSLALSEDGKAVERLAAAGYRPAVTYHPADRFWPFQASETAMFGTLSLLLAGFCFLRIRPC
jgi:hypothetical protein